MEKIFLDMFFFIRLNLFIIKENIDIYRIDENIVKVGIGESIFNLENIREHEYFCKIHSDNKKIMILE
jgi:hypothetical protein